MHRGRLVGVLAAVATLGGMFTLAPAHAFTPYRTAAYKASKGNASILGLLTTPSLDITGVSFGSNGQYLRFFMDLATPSRNPPYGTDVQDFIWRFSYGAGKTKTQVIIEITDFILPGVNLPDYIGVTTAASGDTIANCASCYGVINLPMHRAEFYATLDDLNSTIGAAAAGTPAMPKGAVITVIGAATQAEYGGGVLLNPPTAVVTDTAAPTNGLSLKT